MPSSLRCSSAVHLAASAARDSLLIDTQPDKERERSDMVDDSMALMLASVRSLQRERSSCDRLVDIFASEMTASSVTFAQSATANACSVEHNCASAEIAIEVTFSQPVSLSATSEGQLCASAHITSSVMALHRCRSSSRSKRRLEASEMIARVERR